MMKKNRLTKNQIRNLPGMIERFLGESDLKYDPTKFVLTTMNNISLGILSDVKHDTWISDDCYCLCKEEIDSDGERVYTAYQLWITPEKRGFREVRKLIKFLKFYTQKQGFKRLYILTSRLDKYKAYKRGLGKDFKEKVMLLSKEI